MTAQDAKTLREVREKTVKARRDLAAALLLDIDLRKAEPLRASAEDD